MNATGVAGTVTISPVLRVDYNEADTEQGSLWTVAAENEVISWKLSVGTKVVTRDDDDLRFNAVVTSLRRASARRWVVEMDCDFTSEDA